MILLLPWRHLQNGLEAAAASSSFRAVVINRGSPFKFDFERTKHMENQKRILGIDIGGSSVKMGVLDSKGGITDVRKIPTIVSEPEQMADKISEAALDYTPDIVGVGTAGRVDHKTNLVSAGNLKWKNIPLKTMLEERLKKPVWIDNDAQAAMMAESHSGVCKGARCAIFITLGTGLGGGLVINGKPWRGDDNTAFELGHIITHGNECDWSGKTAKGRLEYYASAQSLSRMAGGKSSREVVDGVLEKEPWALNIFDMFLHELAIGLLSIIPIFNPDVIAIGGGLSITGDYLLNGIRKELSNSYAGAFGFKDTQVKLAVHHNNAGMIGAAALAKLYLQARN